MEMVRIQNVHNIAVLIPKIFSLATFYSLKSKISEYILDCRFQKRVFNFKFLDVPDWGWN